MEQMRKQIFCASGEMVKRAALVVLWHKSTETTKGNRQRAAKDPEITMTLPRSRAHKRLTLSFQQLHSLLLILRLILTYLPNLTLLVFNLPSFARRFPLPDRITRRETNRESAERLETRGASAAGVTGGRGAGGVQESATRTPNAGTRTTCRMHESMSGTCVTLCVCDNSRHRDSSSTLKHLLF